MGARECPEADAHSTQIARALAVVGTRLGYAVGCLHGEWPVLGTKSVDVSRQSFKLADVRRLPLCSCP